MIPAGVAWALEQENHSLAGLDAVFAGDIPIGAGVSSSAAVEVAFIMAWEKVSNLNLSNVERAKIGQMVENDYLGLDSGIMDQFACIHGKKDALLYLDCRTLNYELIPFPEDTGILIADTGIRRQLTHSEYNSRRQQCKEALAILRQHLPEIRALRDVDVDTFNLYAHRLPDPLQKRARHVVEECARVNDGAAALINGDLNKFGQLIQDSHISSRELYEVSVAELDVLAESCWDTPGCLGARLTGAGFGGCVAAIIQGAAILSIKEKMESGFFSRFGRLPAIFSCQVADGAEIFKF
jgi:galactokinase